MTSSCPVCGDADLAVYMEGGGETLEASALAGRALALALENNPETAENRKTFKDVGHTRIVPDKAKLGGSRSSREV